MDSKPLVIILLGPPGVGKGTQAIQLSHKLHLPHISTGEIFRDNIKRKTPLGLQTQKLIESGQLVSDELVSEIVLDRVKALDCKQGYILDGYPRTEVQALSLEAFLKNQARLKVINYFVEDELIIERLTGRLTCSHCAQPFHRLFHPPKKEGVCDHCEHRLEQRKDDQKSVVIERLMTYKKQTAPLIRFYESKSLLTTVFCEGSIEEILDKTLTLLNH